MMRALRWLAPAAAAVTYGLVVLGGVVRVSGSGLGCPDWPLCHGHLLPPLDLHAIIEYSHRTTASLASLLLAATALTAWVQARRRPDLRRPATAALFLLALQVTLGAVTVLLELPPIVVLVHLATAQALLGAACVTAAAVLLPLPAAGVIDQTSLRAARRAAGAAYLLILSGSLVVGSGASAACTGWPLCGAGLSLSLDRLPLIQLAHRGLAALLGLVIVVSLVTVVRRLGSARPVRLWVALTLAALAFQVAVGAAVVLLDLPAALHGLHLALATAVWAGTVALSVMAARLPAEPAVEAIGTDRRLRAGRPFKEAALDYLSLAKPRIIPLLLITALGSMMIAARGWPSTRLVVLTLLGGALAAAGAGAINCWIDRDLDAQMQRTRRRPLPAGRIAPRQALAFGIVLGTLAFLVLAFGVNVLAATLALGALLFYVLVYTAWLKRSTAQNIVIGGAAGAMPPLVGWAAVTHSLDLTALYLFAIVFFWTPPHFWALALWLKGDYARARIPMLPVVVPDRQARRLILWYTILLVALTMMLFATRALGYVYLVGALLLGGGFIAFAVANLVDRRRRFARPLFNYSLAYLAVLFGVMVADRLAA
jgi:protoheme IX farnesyltransferase